MKRDDLNDLAALVAVADAASFTLAAARLGMSPSALSHAIKGLEARLGVRLLARTTRSVAPTAAGDRLLATLRPALASIDSELTALSGLRDKPAGTVRISTFRQAADTAVWPMLPAFLEANPNIIVEMTIDDALIDIVADRYDAGIRFGELVDKDMIAVRVGPDIVSAVVGSPSYLARNKPPRVPQDLSQHRCIGYRNSTSGGLYPWEFEKGGRALQVRVDGPLILNDSRFILAAALAGVGLAYAFEADVVDNLAAGHLVRVLKDWSWTAPGYHLYYPKQRHASPALMAFVDAIRFRPDQRRP
ncbi:LysR family transcriptional regulator [Lichenicola cladoniae]|uniref:LysR family transcriptional regulator n=1 Tax=Lichenicola cladoniae TaxID=1484109 RepID=A0A6M8HS13_9PROT|nr:LysR family transcriptional regulator [Lichenicola cladoniae]NPD65692.1 LysR family transcriptional regulator [Acetobacteraceae bacterium]QKE91283.1 LysR family transcriptional regulator [Lichenicola cladoniae]